MQAKGFRGSGWQGKGPQHAVQGGGAHALWIHQRAASLNDHPDNGLALTPDAHWMFDRGLWTVDERHRVRVASERAFTEWAPPGFLRLVPRNGQELFFRDGCAFRPDWNHFAWHRRERFQG